MLSRGEFSGSWTEREGGATILREDWNSTVLMISSMPRSVQFFNLSVRDFGDMFTLLYLIWITT